MCGIVKRLHGSTRYIILVDVVDNRSNLSMRREV